MPEQRRRQQDEKFTLPFGGEPGYGPRLISRRNAFEKGDEPSFIGVRDEAIELQPRFRLSISFGRSV